MAIHPDSSFPLRPSDQADVIRIFLELMRARHPAEHTSEVTTNRPLGPYRGSDRSSFPERLDLD